MNESKKPRIAEILGVEVGEAFSIDGYPTDYGMVQVCEDGKIRRRCPKEIREVTQLEVGHKIGSNALYYLLNHPERIIRKSRWTEQDKEDAKALRRLIPDAYILYRYSANTFLKLYDRDDNFIMNLNDCFPVLPLGKKVTLYEIIGGEE